MATETAKQLADFYISYAMSDRHWAEWLAWTLEEAGYRVILRIWSFQPGADFRQEIERSIKWSTHTLLVASPEYLTKLNAQEDWIPTFETRMRGSMLGVIPIIVSRCKLEGLLSTLAPINIYSLEEASARNLLLHQLSNRGIKPATVAQISEYHLAQFPIPHPSLASYIARESGDNIVSEIFKKAFSVFSDATEWIRMYGPDVGFLSSAGTEYAGQLEERNNSMRILGMTKPVPLRSIYTRVNILEKITSRHRETLEDLERFFDRDRRHFGKIRETKDGIEVINQLEKSIVLGKPGAGKTTFLKFISLQALDNRLIEKRIPVFISVKAWGDSDLSLLDYLIDQFAICHFPNPGQFVIRLLTSGSFLILLDGLDEVSTNVELLIKQVRDMSTEYHTNKYIISCRIAAYNYEFENFTDLELADFSDRQIQSFISNWFVDDPRTGDQCWQKMSESPAIRELGSVPLLLTLLCLAFHETLTFPPNRAELYKEAIDALLRKWDTTRRIKRVQLYENFSIRRKETMFSQIAMTTFEKSQYFLPQRTLENYILDFVRHLPEVESSGTELDGEAILKSIEHQHGIFVERARGIYSFSHLTFQEYFAAKYLIENEARGTISMLMDRHLTDARWHEVFLIVAGMLPNGDEFLTSMKRHIDNLLTSKVNAVLVRIQRKVKSREEFLLKKKLPRGVARIYALYRAFEHMEHDRKFGRIGNSNLTAAHAVTRDTFLELFSYLGISPTVELTDWLDVDLDFTLTLNEKLAGSLIVYIRANHVLVRCLNSECYVTQDTRNWLLDELLNPPAFSKPSPQRLSIVKRFRRFLYPGS